MAISDVTKNFRDGTLLLEDGTAVTPLAITIQYEDGDFSTSGLMEDQKAITQYANRGDFYKARKTIQNYPTFSFSAHYTDLADGTEKTLFDFVHKLGAFSAGVSTLGADAEVFACKLTWTVAGTAHGDATDHVLALDDCHLSMDISEGDPNTFSISGTIMGTITGT